MLTKSEPPKSEPPRPGAAPAQQASAAAPADSRRRSRAERRKARPRWLRLLIATVNTLLALALLLAAGAAGVYWYFSRDLPSGASLGSHRPFETTKIYARDGTTLLYEVFDPQGGQRTVIPFSELPETLKQATIAVEDANFYTNPGVNLPSVFRAVYANLTDRDQGQGGASTITQQLVRNVLLPPEERAQQTPRRKIREMILAYRITKEYSKEQVLALYLNEIPYGNSAYGAEAAALAYFGVHARDLSLAQSALLAGLPQSPSQLDPLVNPRAAKARQRIVLDRMVATGYITKQQADAAFAETLYVKPAQVDLRAPHFVFYVRDQLEARYGPELLYRGGLRVTTTLDPKWQDAAQAEVAKRVEEIRGQNATNGALVMLDRQTNQVLALIGSADYNNAEIDGQVNVALADRQPGSTLKPLVYATAMMQGWTAAKVLWDVPTEYHFAGGEVYAPKNYDRLFHGPVSMRVALANSFNVPAVKTLDQIGLDTFLRQLHNMGISTLNDRPRYGLSLALGGGEVKLMELTAAYSVLANAGNYRPPVTILRVENTRGEVLEAWREPKAKPVLGPNGAQIAYVMSSMLSDNQARQWMFGPGNAMELPDGRPAAVKTGTTDDDRDSWTVGYTPQVVVGAWVGNSDNSPMDAVPGSFGAAVIWQRLMTEFHKGLPVEQFPRPGGIVEREVCVASGLLATPACPNKRTELFVEGTEPTEADPIYKMVRVGPGGDCLAGPNQPGEERPFAEYPAEAGDWASQGGLPPPPTRPCVDGSTGVADLPAVIVEPASGATVGSSVRIRGSAAGPYVLDWGRGERPSSWQTILEGFGGVKNGLLGMWSHGEPEGVYTIRLRVQQPGGQLEQRVTITVARAFQPTSVALAVPAGGRAGKPVDLTATVAGTNPPQRVEFEVDEQLVGKIDQAPYVFQWSFLTPGQHRVRAIAVDSAGSRIVSETRVITISN